VLYIVKKIRLQRQPRPRIGCPMHSFRRRPAAGATSATAAEIHPYVVRRRTFSYEIGKYSRSYWIVATQNWSMTVPSLDKHGQLAVHRVANCTTDDVFGKRQQCTIPLEYTSGGHKPTTDRPTDRSSRPRAHRKTAAHVGRDFVRYFGRIAGCIHRAEILLRTALERSEQE